MSTSKPILSRRILSPCHCEEPTSARLLQELSKAVELDFNEIHIGAAMHEEAIGNLDGFIEYEGWLEKANTGRPMNRIRHQRDVLNGFCEKSRAAGVKTYLWHHELWFPDAVKKAFAKKFKDGRIDPTGKFAENYLGSRFKTARKQLPQLDGLILTLAETSQVVYQADAPESKIIEQTTAFLKLLDRSLREAGWDYVLRLFCWEEKEYRIMSGAIARLPKKPVVMIKAVPFDWHMHFPVDPVIAKFGDSNLIVELGTNNEYWGVNRIPCANPDDYIGYLTKAMTLAPKMIGVAARTDRDDVSVWETPNEINLRAVSAVAHGVPVTGKQLAEDFAGKRYGVTSIARFGKLLLGTGEVTAEGYYERGRHLNGTYIGHLIGTHNLFQQARDLFFEPGDTAFHKARLEVEAKAASLRQELEAMKQELSTADQRDLADSLELLEALVKANSLTCDVLYGLRCSMYDRAWRSEAKWKAWKKETLDLADAVERKFGSDLFDFGVFAQGMVYPGSLSDRLRLLVKQQAEVLKKLEFRKPGLELLQKKPLSYQGRKAFELPVEAIRVSAKAGKNPLVLVMQAGSEMAVTRPLRFRVNGGADTIKPLGTFGWFKCCEGYRTYEIELPATKGGLEIELASADPNHPVRLSSLRFEERISGTRGELLTDYRANTHFPWDAEKFKSPRKSTSKKKAS